MCCFYPFKDENELLSSFPHLYQKKLQEQGVQDVVNLNNVFTCKRVLFLSSQVYNALQMGKWFYKCIMIKALKWLI